MRCISSFFTLNWIHIGSAEFSLHERYMVVFTSLSHYLRFCGFIIRAFLCSFIGRREDVRKSQGVELLPRHFMVYTYINIFYHPPLSLSSNRGTMNSNFQCENGREERTTERGTSRKGQTSALFLYSWTNSHIV